VRRRLGLLALAALPLASAAPPARAAESSVRSEHALVSGDVPVAWVEEASALVEAVYPLLSRYFGAEPPPASLPLLVTLLPTRERFLAATREAGATEDLSEAGGYTAWEQGVSYVWVQPEPFDTRRLVIHEATHQFQVKAVQEGIPDRDVLWHREGLAEHFGWHRRAKAGLEVGALDVVALSDRPAQAAARVAAGAFDPWAVGAGAVKPDYTDGLCLLETLLRTKDEDLRARFEAWEEDAFRHRDAAARFGLKFAGRKEQLLAAAREVWGAYRRPWKPRGAGWDERDGALVGRHESLGLLEGGAPLGPGRASIDAVVEVSRGGVAGLCLGVREGRWLALELSDGLLRLVLAGEAGERVLAEARVSSEGPLRLRLLAEGAWATGDVLAVPPEAPHVQARLEDAGCTAEELAGVPGLLVKRGEATFRDVRLGN
jgi:hypothetical protein